MINITGLYDKSGEIFRIYNAAFSYFPDPDGLKYWIENYTKKKDDYKDITKSFILSKEFISKCGNNISNNLFVEKIYTNVLGRDYDIEGFNYWTGNLDNNIEERWSVLWNISQSNENIHLFSEVTGILI